MQILQLKSLNCTKIYYKKLYLKAKKISEKKGNLRFYCLQIITTYFKHKKAKFKVFRMFIILKITHSYDENTSDALAECPSHSIVELTSQVGDPISVSGLVGFLNESCGISIPLY